MYVCYAIYRSNNCQPLTQYTVCMLRYVPQYPLSDSYPIYSMYVTLYTAVTTVSLLPNIQYVCYAIYRSTHCQPLTQYTVCMLRYIPQYQLSASYPIYSMYVTLYTAETTVSILPNIQYVCYAIYRRTNCQPLTQCTVCFYAKYRSTNCQLLTQYTVCMIRYVPQYQLSAPYPI